ANFEEHSFEQNRKDNKKKLTRNAIPTLSPFRPVPKHRKPPSRSLMQPTTSSSAATSSPSGNSNSSLLLPSCSAMSSSSCGKARAASCCPQQCPPYRVRTAQAAAWRMARGSTGAVANTITSAALVAMKRIHQPGI
ncbi:hypothetical protein MTO96_038233, partial [Rhipicephalus appendiculatus]